MKAWITEYALTDGVREVEGERTGLGMFVVKMNDHDIYFTKKNWHESREAAIERAEMLRLNRIASLRKSIARLEKLSFT